MRIDAYTNMLVGGVRRLIDAGVRDPTIVEIAHESFNKPLPADDPWIEPTTLGGEVYQGVFARLRIIREALRLDHGILALPVTRHYYETGQRERDMPNEEEVPACVASIRGGRRTVGIRIVKPQNDDAFLPFYLESVGTHAAKMIRNAMEKTETAIGIGSMSSQRAINMTRAIGQELGDADRVIRRIANGGGGGDDGGGGGGGGPRRISPA